jgi:hypothetical protein
VSTRECEQQCEKPAVIAVECIPDSDDEEIESALADRTDDVAEAKEPEPNQPCVGESESSDDTESDGESELFASAESENDENVSVRVSEKVGKA